MQYLHIFLILQLIVCSSLVIACYSPVNSVLFLILSFISASAILILFGCDFLGILFIIIYVGAIAVLFLFIVMMLSPKNLLLGVGVPVIEYIFLYGLIYFFVSSCFYFDLNSDVVLFNYNFDSLSNIDLFGQSLYNNFLPCFLVAGLILLVSMIGAIVLTMNFSSARKNELVFRQLSRSDNFLSFFK